MMAWLAHPSILFLQNIPFPKGQLKELGNDIMLSEWLLQVLLLLYRDTAISFTYAANNYVAASSFTFHKDRQKILSQHTTMVLQGPTISVGDKIFQGPKAYKILQGFKAYKILHGLKAYNIL